MEAAEDEWWRRMERDATIDYSVRGSALGASNPELMDITCAVIPSERLSSSIFSEELSNLSDEERCACITTATMKKGIAQNLYDAYAAALTGHSPDDDDLKEIKILHVNLQHAMRDKELCKPTNRHRPQLIACENGVSTVPPAKLRIRAETPNCLKHIQFHSFSREASHLDCSDKF
ncbi:hypothetical protein CEXT_70881 [Caerostris extrusa]|uniref:Uncharacterized protein n=1 Tax=Caerostris extrusa TaxID=172846 RepID=A0AAV4RKD0_CAEEX|nr:hypothetical protein CEXT_70881 [Caerostris extrusa]